MTNLPFSGRFKVTQPYGVKSNGYIAGYHTGIDLVGISSDIVYSVSTGQVIMARIYGSYGFSVKVRDNITKKVYLFGHLRKMFVKVGDRVTRTSKIGLMGNTGNSRGVHLHFEVRTPEDKYGWQENPCNWLGIPNEKGTYDSKNYTIDKTFYNTFSYVEVNIPIKDTGARKSNLIVGGNDVLVDSNGYQFWIHESLIKNSKVIARVRINKKLNDIYYMEVIGFGNQFQCIEKYITKKL